MINIKELLKTTKIYNSDDLQSFLLSLESKYKIEMAQEKYYNLVNFSTNATVPYHQWFKYREGFASELITELIKMSEAKQDEYIIDPFCGSGTTNVVAVLNGFNSIGLDINPMSAFITDAKIAHYSDEDIKQVLSLLDEALSYKETVVKPGYEDVRKYFKSGHFNELIRIKTYIDNISESKAKTVLFVAYLSIIMECSERKRDGNGLKVQVSKVDNVAQCFSDKVNLIIEDVKSIQPLPGTKGHGIYDTAYNLYDEFLKYGPNIKAGAIIFSPPYANSFDYFESYKLELVMGDFANDMNSINELRKRAVRSFIGGEVQETCDKYVELIAKEIENAIPKKEKETGKKDTRTRKVPNMIRAYFSDMHEVIRQCSLCLEAGKKTYIVVGQSAYVGKIIPTDLLLAYLGEQENFRVGRIIECRKARTSTQQLNKYPFLKTTLRESIIELIKK